MLRKSTYSRSMRRYKQETNRLIGTGERAGYGDPPVDGAQQMPEGEQVQKTGVDDGMCRCADGGKGYGAGDGPRNQRRDHHGGILQRQGKTGMIRLNGGGELVGEQDGQGLVEAIIPSAAEVSSTATKGVVRSASLPMAWRRFVSNSVFWKMPE